jgi:hypothetical protein
MLPNNVPFAFEEVMSVAGVVIIHFDLCQHNRHCAAQRSANPRLSLSASATMEMQIAPRIPYHAASLSSARTTAADEKSKSTESIFSISARRSSSYLSSPLFQ